MTNYYPLLASVVAALEPNTAEARRQLYESARVGFPNYLGNLDPPLSDAEVTRERTALEEVIRRLEAEQMAATRDQEISNQGSERRVLMADA
jgi:AAA+ ATPase superfamily predicted ATPase